MHRPTSLALTALLTLALAAPAVLLPARAGAASQNAGGDWRRGYPGLTGTLVATPQNMLPATLFLQVGGTTIPVVITAATAVSDANGNSLSLTAMVDGDTLRIDGPTDQSGQVDATLVQDLSQPTSSPTAVPSTYQASGTLAAAYPNLLCLQNASVAGGAIAPNAAVASPCPSNDLSVYVTSTTSIENASGAGIAVTSLAFNDSLTATGSLVSGLFTASLVLDLTQSVTTVPTLTYQVSGTLAVAYSSVLCLQNANVSSGTLSPNALVSSPCPSNELAVYLTSATSFVNAGDTAITASGLNVNDSLAATGTLSNGQFTASQVQDLTLVTPTPTATPALSTSYQVTGAVATNYGSILCLQNVSVTGSTISPNAVINGPCPSNDLAVYVTGSTSVVNASNTGLAATAVSVNDTVMATGTVSNGQFVATLVQDVTQSTTVNQSSSLTLVGTVQSYNFTGRNHSITIRVSQGAMRGTYTISVQGSAQVLARSGSHTKYTALRKGQTVTFTAPYAAHGHRWGAITRIQIH